MGRKRLILCCDGTWNRADQEKNDHPCPTNVVKIAYRIAKHAGDVPQLVYYDHGVGTGNAFDRLTGGAFGSGLIDNVFDAYRFLIANYVLDDELFFFGFSRGAFTVRSLAGMIRKCGILRRTSVSQYRRALELYKDPAVHPDSETALSFRTEHSVCGGRGIRIEFLGVWDTVGALGIPLRGLRWLTRRKYQFHDTTLSSWVKHGYQALAIDEHRAPFRPAIWNCIPKEGQHVEQVWFCGAHSDVGGGYVETDLSDIALAWMMEKADGAGLVFGDSFLEENPPQGDPLGKIHDSKRGLYRLTFGIDRVIGMKPGDDAESPELDPRQSIHPSVLERWDADDDYRPDNLREYLRRKGDPRVGQ